MCQGQGTDTRDLSELSSDIAYAEDDDFETKTPARKKHQKLDSVDSHLNGEYNFVEGKHAKAGAFGKEVKQRKSSSFKCGCSWRLKFN